jgi:NAD(P)-dependent dehydrogenase (short-subunit alcohol dehydrogenase family)
MIRFDGKVALVTGAGSGLGREHAIALAARGAKVVINDIARSAALAVVQEIESLGGMAVAYDGSVTDAEMVTAMVGDVTAQWGSVDILVNNAGILRDKSFTKMSLDDFRAVLDVHVMGAVHCTKAVWNGMRERNYGRIVMTTSSSGLWGNFGQANYGAAKMALVGLMQTLSLEGAKNNIRVNCLAPTAATAMTEGLLTAELKQAFRSSTVTPGLLWLVSEDAPTRLILCAGGGVFAAANIALNEGVFVGDGVEAAEQVQRMAECIARFAGSAVPPSGAVQSQNELAHISASYRA